MPSLHRRAFLRTLAGAALLGASPRARAEAQLSDLARDLTVVDLTIPGDKKLGERFVLLIPKHLKAGERVPLLVLLHGLGETGDQRMGAFAWIERYGLTTAYERLRRPPLVRTAKRRDLTDARLTELNTSLAAQPFRGLVIACPYTPNVARAADRSAALDKYARWITSAVIPRARKEAPVFPDAAHTAIGGCSLGGYVGLEVFLREPQAFVTFSGVQSAFGAHRAPGYGDRIAEAIARTPELGSQKPRIFIETSQDDPFREANVSLSQILTNKGIPNDKRVLPGPHDQPWLREAGTLELLLWNDRRLR